MDEQSLRSRTIDLWGERNPGLDTSPMEVVAQVKRISSLLELAVAPIYANAGISASDIDLLVPLRYADHAVTAVRLAEMLGMSRAGVSKTLAKLERRELIERAPNPVDRRSVSITIADKGRELVDDVFPRELAAHADALAGLADERATVMSALEKLATVMECRLEGRPSDVGL